MKFATLMTFAVAASAITLKRSEDTEVEEEFETLSQASPSDSFSVAVQTYGTQGANTCKNGDTATVNYTGKLKDGRVFDTSVKDGGQPFKFTVGASEVISCWDDALGQMSSGEAATVTCPSNMAYGAQGAPGSIIGPDATLVFDINVLNCESAM